MPDYSARRLMMVDTQVRPSDVTKFPIIKAMLDIPRERFVPGDLVEAAYAGKNLTVAPGRVMLDPRTFAKMLDALGLTGTDLVLDVAPGMGYSSAVLAQMVQAVVAVEPDEALAAEAEAAFQETGAPNVLVERCDLAEGAPRHGPYDAIMIQGGIERFPESLAAQLKENGRVVALFMPSAMHGVVRLGVKRDDAIHWRDLFNAAAPVLDGFTQRRSFVF
ncbi:MAG: protein-L-isoaspartate O-methyltransferase [Pararhodobacter sp.]|nr:protein-L-isoaspartate O-methyltransferase [Pararhodobacter sp.]